MAHILIVMWVALGGGAGSLTAEFQNLAACEAAKANVIDGATAAYGLTRKVFALCEPVRR